MSMIQTLKNKVLAASIAVTEFKNNQKGVTAVEYAVVIAGVTILVLAIFGKTGPVNKMLSTVFSTVQTTVTGAISNGM
jgi:pilus assembly protein Flp/PilA